MIWKVPTEADVNMVLDHCGPRRLPNAKNKTTEEASKVWIRNLLDNKRGAEAIATAVMSVWYAMTCHEQPDDTARARRATIAASMRKMRTAGVVGNEQERKR